MNKIIHPQVIIISLELFCRINKNGNQFKNTIGTAGHNRKTHRIIAIQSDTGFQDYSTRNLPVNRLSLFDAESR
jgi:hypothetical protein